MRNDSEQARWNLGLFLIFLVALIWTGSSVLVQYIFDGLDFHAPLFLTYVCTSLFAVQLPLWHAAARLGLAAPLPWRGEGDAYASLSDVVVPVAAAAAVRRGGGQQGAEAVEPAHGCGVVGKPPRMARRGVARIGLLVFPLWFLANYAYNASLSLTSVTSSTGAYMRLCGVAPPRPRVPLASPPPPPLAPRPLTRPPLRPLARHPPLLTLVISTTSSIFTFGFATRLGAERFSVPVLLGVCCAFGGTVMTAVADQVDQGGGGGSDDGGGGGDQSTETAWGDAVALFGAAMYGLYTVAIRRFVPDDGSVSLSLFFGYMGLSNMLLLWPLVLAFSAARLEPLGAVTPEIMGWLVVKGLCDNVLSDYLWARAVVLTSPTVATVGLGLTVPLAIVADALAGKLARGASLAYQIVGAAMVVVGFVLTNAKECRCSGARRAAAAAAAAAAASERKPDELLVGAADAAQCAVAGGGQAAAEADPRARAGENGFDCRIQSQT